MTLQERLSNLIKERDGATDKMKVILDAADTEKRDLPADEEKQYTELDKAVDGFKKEEERTRKLIQDNIVLDAPKATIRTSIRAEAPKEFQSLGEFMYSVRFNENDSRLNYVEVEKREQSMGVGVEGGFMVPNQFLPLLRMVDPQTEIFRPRCTVIPAGTPPDASVTMPCLDQGPVENIYGGMVVQWIAEGATKPETDLRLREVCLTPHEVAAHTVLSDKLLRNWTSADALVTQMLRLAMRGAEDTAFYSGSGVGQPQGVINSPARLDVGRAGANLIDFADIVNMYSRVKFGGSLVWIASQTTLPELTTIADGGNHLLWAPVLTGIIGSIPGTLYGIPVILADRSVALGTRGDLILADLSYYLIKDGSGPFVAASPHVYFTTNKTVIKIFWNVDGQSWLNLPLGLEGSVANTVSPFVVLN
jgi:HK97 family phage major capsid protein